LKIPAEVLFNGEEVTRRYLAENPKLVQDAFKNIQSDKDLHQFVVSQGGRIISSLGKEVDRIELDLKNKAPEVKHCDLEIL
jgi:hypothetical protein